MKNPGFWRLFVAYAIDYILVRLVLIGIFLIILFQVTGLTLNMAVGEMLGLTVFAFYLAMLERKNGASLGKRWQKVKVVPAEGKTLGFGNLFGAYLIDGIMAAVFMMIAGYVSVIIITLPLSILLTLLPFTQIIAAVFGFLIFLFWYIFYYAFSESKWGYSIGKKLMDLQVVQEETK